MSAELRGHHLLQNRKGAGFIRLNGSIEHLTHAPVDIRILLGSTGSAGLAVYALIMTMTQSHHPLLYIFHRARPSSSVLSSRRRASCAGHRSSGATGAARTAPSSRPSSPRAGAAWTRTTAPPPRRRRRPTSTVHLAVRRPRGSGLF